MKNSYIEAIKAGLEEASVKGVLADNDYRKELAPYLNRVRSTKSTLQVLKRQRNVIEDDLKETMEVEKRRRVRPPFDDGLLARAYRDTILTRVMSAEGKQKGRHFDQSAFKKEVNSYYSVVSPSNDQQIWCHVLGMFVGKKMIKAAHLVPKSLDREELAHLFGDRDTVISLPQNALSLHHKIESLLDRGEIAIVPMPGPMKEPSDWRCIVLKDSIKNNIVYERDRVPGEPHFIIRVKDLDNRQLKFMSSNRPRRRYLYMRFIISYLWCKRNAVPGLDEKVESKRFWPSAGTYLERSTLQTLARCISGCQIPKDLTAEHTFDHPSRSERNVSTGMAMAADLIDMHTQTTQPTGSRVMDALTETMKRV